MGITFVTLTDLSPLTQVIVCGCNFPFFTGSEVLEYPVGQLGEGAVTTLTVVPLRQLIVRVTSLFPLTAKLVTLYPVGHLGSAASTTFTLVPLRQLIFVNFTPPETLNDK